MTYIIDGLTALMVLALAVVFGGAVSQLKEKKKGVTRAMLRGAHVALVCGAALLFIKYTSERVVGFLFDRWHLLAYGLILVIVAGLAYFYRKAKGSVPVVWAVIGLAAGTGIVLHLFW